MTGRSILALLLPTLLLAWWLLEESGDVRELAGTTMGTTWAVQLPQVPANLSPDELAALIQGELERLDRGIFSTWAPDSELSRFNRAPPGEDFPASPELIEVVLLAQEIHALSGGAFDMTVGPLVDLWGFGPAPPPAGVPSGEAIAEARALLGSASVTADPARGILRKSRPVRLDLSGIAKGFAVDRIARLLEARGIGDYLVEIGGELRSRGLKAEGEPWTLAIESPQPGPRRALRVLTLPATPLAVAGSGDYRNFFELEGRRYSHELDPRSGWPVNHALTAVTVVDRSAARADALATALMVLGVGEGHTLASGLDLASDSMGRINGLNIAAYLIMRGDQGYQAVESAAFARILQEAGAPASQQ